MLRYALNLLLILAVLVLMPACESGATPRDNNKIGVVVSLLPQAEFVSRVGGERVDVTVMIPPGASPHTYEVTPAQMVKLSKARIYFKVGSPLEFELAWMVRFTDANKDLTVIDCSRGIELISSTDPHEPGIDTHIWTSPRNVGLMVRNICEGLSQVDAAHQEEYLRNRDSYLAELDKLDADISLALQGAELSKFIVYHPAWGYFARDYGLTQLSVEQEGKEPRPAYMSRLIREAKEEDIKVIFISPEFDSKSAESIAREIEGSVVIISPLAGDYLDNMRRVAQAFREALQRR